MSSWYASLEEVPATVAQVAGHVDHVRAVAGVASIGIGGDFDGAGAMPAGLEDVSGYPALFAELRARGYTDERPARSPGGTSCA
ncbi:MAG: membrane dipeptidase [Actinomycetota bacterium]